MGCANCAAAIRSELEKLPGVAEISLDPENKAASVALDESLSSESAVFQAVRQAGFTPEK